MEDESWPDAHFPLYFLPCGHTHETPTEDPSTDSIFDEYAGAIDAFSDDPEFIAKTRLVEPSFVISRR
ncbi:hypothetical protein ACX80I_12595 [Arthrobacter sp. MDT3-44]